MRRARRAWAGWRGEYLIRARRQEVASEIAAALALPHPPVLTPQGARGHDSIYYVSAAGEFFGVLRLLNPFKKRLPPPQGMPFRRISPEESMEREWQAYTKASALNLTPTPLWRTHDAMLCAYLPLHPLQERLQKTPDEAWKLINAATRRLHGLHQAGLVHMDASLSNILADAGLVNLVFIDFEYSPAEGLSIACQRAYDFLRLVESSLKFIPKRLRVPDKEWLALMKEFFEPSLGSPDLERLAPALPRLLAEPALKAQVENFFGA